MNIALPLVVLESHYMTSTVREIHIVTFLLLFMSVSNVEQTKVATTNSGYNYYKHTTLDYKTLTNR